MPSESFYPKNPSIHPNAEPHSTHKSSNTLQTFRDFSIDLRTLKVDAIKGTLSEEAKAAASELTDLYRKFTPRFVMSINGDSPKAVAPNMVCLPDYLALNDYSRSSKTRLHVTGDFQIILSSLEKDPFYGILIKYGSNQYFLGGAQRLFSLPSKEEVLAAIQSFSQENNLHYVPGPSASYTLALEKILKTCLTLQNASFNLVPLQSVGWKQENTRSRISYAIPQVFKNDSDMERMREQEEEALVNADVGQLHKLATNNRELHKKVASHAKSRGNFDVPMEAWQELGTESLEAIKNVLIADVLDFYRAHTEGYPKIYENIANGLGEFSKMLGKLLTQTTQPDGAKISEGIIAAKRGSRRHSYEDQVAGLVEEHVALLRAVQFLSSPSSVHVLFDDKETSALEAPTASSLPNQSDARTHQTQNHNSDFSPSSNANPSQNPGNNPPSIISGLSHEELRVMKEAMERLFSEKRFQGGKTLFDAYEGKLPKRALNFLKEANLAFIAIINELLKKESSKTNIILI